MVKQKATDRIVFDETKLSIVDINKVKPNTWNPKELDTEEYTRILRSIQLKGLRSPIVVREIDNSYEIIDGEQRWRACQQLKFSNILIYNEGEMTELEAQELMVLYQQQVPFLEIGLAELIQSIVTKSDEIRGVGKAELPYTNEEMQNYIDFLTYSWDQHNYTKPEGDDQAEKWITFTARCPKSAWDGVIRPEIMRIMDIIEPSEDIADEVVNGMILEKIAVLSSLTPTESLE